MSVAACGGAGILCVGYVSGFLELPNCCQSIDAILFRLALTFFAPSLFEEFIFRVLVVRRVTEKIEAHNRKVDFVDTIGPDVDANDVVPANRESSLELPRERPPPSDCDIGTEHAIDPQTRETQEKVRSTSCRLRSVARSFSSKYAGRPHVAEQFCYLVLFEVYHLDAIHSNPMFRDGVFLLIAFLLGVVCQELLFLTGSVWPGVLFHWMAVWLWQSFL